MSDSGREAVAGQIDASAREPSYLLRSPRGRYLKLTPSAYHLLQKRREGASFEELAAILRTGAGQPLSVEQAEAAYHKLAARIEAIEQTDSLPHSGFWLRLPLLSEKVVVGLGAVCSQAFRPAIAVALFVLVAAAGFWTSRQTFELHFTSGSLALGYALLLVSVLLHEIGHASACSRYGARPGAIGCGVYLIYPVFYTDVTSAWELRRWQRVVVDLGGLYFQVVVGALYALAYACWGWEPLKVGLMLIGGSMVFSLNPFFKFDGYWVMSDALGVPNLGREPRQILTWVGRRLRGQPVPPLPWPGWIVAVLGVYSGLTFAVFGWFFWNLTPLLRYRILPYPAQLFSFGEHLARHSAAISARAWGDFLVSTYLFATALFLLSRFVLPLPRSLWGRLSLRRSRKVDG